MRSALVLVLAFMLGCVSTDEPPFDVTIASTLTDMSFDTASDRWECRYRLTATATGGDDREYALWQASEWEFRYDEGGSSTFQMDTLEVFDYWGSDRIRSGETQVAGRVAWSRNRFKLLYHFRLRMPDRSFKSIAHWTPCE